MTVTTFDVKVSIKDENGQVVAVRNINDLEYEFGDNTDESIALHTTEVVHTNFVANAKVGRQALGRSLGSQVNGDGDYTYTDDEIHNLVRDSTLEVRKPGKSQEDKALEAYSVLSDEQKERLLKRFGG